jgi:ankyrin repeat protein
MDAAARRGLDRTRGSGRLLVDRGANASAADGCGRTPLDIAAWFGYEALARLLVDRGADVSAASRSGCTPLQLAARCGHEALVLLFFLFYHTRM